MFRESTPDYVRYLTGLIALLAVMAGLFWPQAARANFTVCNDTQAEVGVSVGYREEGGWITEGWWLIPEAKCAAVIEGKLRSRYFYIFAEDASDGGQWRGPIFMCTSTKQFRIDGLENCYARGFEQTGFFEVDTGEQANWQVRLTDRGRRSQPNTQQAPQPPKDG